jgi:thiamine kinase-like enzyme
VREVLAALEPELGRPDAPPEPLEGGITNRNYRVRFGGRDCVLRLPGKGTELLGIDRAAECAAARAAASIGVGPAVVAYEAALGVLVTAYVDARPATPDELRARLPEVAALLRRIHHGPALPVPCSPLARAEAYREEAERRGGAIPAIYDGAAAAARRIVAALPHEPAPCHSDLLTANFLDDGERLWIVDYEYAGMGDPRFDLANFASHHDLDPGGERALLTTYHGRAPTEAELAAVRLLRMLAAFWEGMWGVLQAAISELDFDFAAYAAEHLGKVRTDLERDLELARAG